MIKIFGYVNDAINYIARGFTYQTGQLTSVFDWNDLKIIDELSDDLGIDLLDGYNISSHNTVEQDESKLEVINSIKNRIKSEHTKYYNSDGLDWAELAAYKIYSSHIKNLK